MGEPACERQLASVDTDQTTTTVPGEGLRSRQVTKARSPSIHRPLSGSPKTAQGRFVTVADRPPADVRRRRPSCPEADVPPWLRASVLAQPHTTDSRWTASWRGCKWAVVGVEYPPAARAVRTTLPSGVPSGSARPHVNCGSAISASFFFCCPARLRPTIRGQPSLGLTRDFDHQTCLQVARPGVGGNGAAGRRAVRQRLVLQAAAHRLVLRQRIRQVCDRPAGAAVVVAHSSALARLLRRRPRRCLAGGRAEGRRQGARCPSDVSPLRSLGARPRGAAVLRHAGDISSASRSRATPGASTTSRSTRCPASRASCPTS